MKTFIAILKHDNGTHRLRVNASSKEAAELMIMLAENCPSRAIISIKEVK